MTEVTVRLKVLREAHGLSRRELADQTGVSHETIRRLEELPGWLPRMRSAKLLAEFFHTDITTLLEPVEMPALRSA